MKNIWLIITFVLKIFTSCTSKNYGSLDSQVIKNLDVERYMGTWYEIYRLPMRAEKDLVNVTATYSLRSDGKINVLNQGYKHSPNGKHKKANAKAWMPDENIQGALIVRFFGLFNSSYHVLYIDKSYQYVVVSTYNREYAWILARTPQLSPELELELVSMAERMGIDTVRFVKTMQKWE